MARISLSISFSAELRFRSKELRGIRKGNVLQPSKLLFPVGKKDYSSDVFIKNQWDEFINDISRTSYLSIFGYSAPVTDKDALSAIEKAFSNNSHKEYAQIEIININPSTTAWENIIIGNHFDSCESFFDSKLNSFPRRTSEYLWEKTMECKIFDYTKKANDFKDLKNLYASYGSLIEEELSKT